ncbi:hypothetical protein EXE25_18105 [Acinetobacter bouvetii]|uniref:Lipoprotein n=1 Tax=Acinetobacter bouvetii TaxID=202951 RepID=A0A4Q7ALT6_9GAMM|nr:hypothetical protein [Acinetobacter bouvetii]RZG63973.1 hypothetical protein EXE25_18105 [Acinetobacter bouvetii]
MKKIVLSLVVTGVLLSGCSMAPIQLPSNVKTIPSGMGESTYIDRIDHSFIPSKVINFSNLKVCAATTFQNESITIRDSAGSFVGAYSGNYYQQNNKQQINGGDVFKLIDEQTNTIVITGNKKTKPQHGGLIIDFIKYDAKISLNNNRVQLLFQNIQAAQQSTGSLSNDGFRPIGTWSGARAPAAIETIEQLAVSFRNCLD